VRGLVHGELDRPVVPASPGAVQTVSGVLRNCAVLLVFLFNLVKASNPDYRQHGAHVGRPSLTHEANGTANSSHPGEPSWNLCRITQVPNLVSSQYVSHNPRRMNWQKALAVRKEGGGETNQW
jgi:hypothetical protein